ncbi:MAG: hypothetical protein Fur0022_16520 [Anaerolineales bacterium]
MSNLTPSSPISNRFQRIGQTVGVLPGEGEPFLLLLGQSFFLGIALITYYSAANALFLSRFSSDTLPYVYLVAAGVIILTGLGFYRLQTLIPFATLLVGNLGILLAGIVGLRILLDVSGQDVIYFSVLVWLRLLWVLGNLGLWTLAGRLFTLRQGKRLFSLILAGGVFAIILTGFLNSPLIEWIGTANLLWVSAGSLTGALWLLVITLRRYYSAPPPPSPSPQVTQPNPSPLFKTPYLWFIFLYTALSTVGTYILDYAFIGQADANLSGDQLGKFFGGYLGVNTLVTLLFLLFLSNRILRRFGVRGGLLVDPFAVGVGALAVVLFSQFPELSAGIFWIVVTTKLLDDVTVVATTNTSVRLMYQPLPADQRVRAQTFVESVISPLSMGLSGALILLFRAILQLTSLQAVYLLLGVVIAWLVMGLLLGNQYYGALQKALRQRYLNGLEDNLFVDETSLQTLETYLKSQRPSDILMAISLLAEHRPQVLQQALPALLHHPEDPVRLAALNQINLTHPTAVDQLTQIIQDPTQSPEIIGLALQRLGGSPENARTLCTAYVDHPNLTIRRGALIGLLHVEPDGLAHEILLAAANAEEAPLRQLAAEVIGKTRGPKYIPALRLLMQDKAPGVRKAAILACGQRADPDLWPGVLVALERGDTRQVALHALHFVGDRALPVLGTALRTAPPSVVVDLIRVCGKLPTATTFTLLTPLIHHPQERVRSEALRVLAHHHYKASATRSEIIEAIQSECQTLAQWSRLFTQLETAPISEAPPLRDALAQVIQRGRLRVITLSTFLLPAQKVGALRDNLFSDNEQVRGNALELLDVALSREKEIRTLVLAVAGSQPAALHQQLSKTFPQGNVDLTPALSQVVEAAENDWLAAYALYTLYSQSPHALTAEILDPPATHPILTQTANWIKTKSAPEPDGALPMLLIEKTLILKTASLFSDTPDDILAELAQYTEEYRVLAGQTIFEKGSPGESMFIIVSGKVRVHDGERTINTLSDREVFGEMALLDAAPRVASVTAVEDTLLLRLAQAPFYEAVDSQVEIARGVIRVLSRHLRERIQDVGRLDAELKALQEK